MLDRWPSVRFREQRVSRGDLSPDSPARWLSMAMRKSQVWPGLGPRWWPVRSPHSSHAVSTGSVSPGGDGGAAIQSPHSPGASIEVCEGRMDIIAAYREVGTYRGAAQVTGTTYKTVKRAIARHGAGGAGPERAHRGHNYDGVAELVRRR
jgi:hypothetical protein